jgi:hypothetical protein
MRRSTCKAESLVQAVVIMRATQPMPFILNMTSKSGAVQLESCIRPCLAGVKDIPTPKPPPIHATPYCQPQPQASLTATTAAVGAFA